MYSTPQWSRTAWGRLVGGRLGGGDGIAGFESRVIGEFGARRDANERRRATDVRREAAIAVEPIGLAKDAGVPFDAALALVEIDAGLHSARRGGTEGALGCDAQGRLVGLPPANYRHPPWRSPGRSWCWWRWDFRELAK